MIKSLQDHGVSPSILESVWKDNMQYRNNWDWAKNASAVRAMKLGDHYGGDRV
jgi:hypothetical protein